MTADGLASMTGYARAGGHVAACTFQCEIKSVNGRGLDIRLRLAPGLDALEAEVRRRIAERLARGSVSVTISFSRQGAAGELVLNESALDTVLLAMANLAGRIDVDRPRPEGILSLKGVLEQRDAPLAPSEEDELFSAILDGVDQALGDLIAARRAEGERLATVLQDRLAEIGRLTAEAENHPSRTRAAIEARLQRQLSEMQGLAPALPEERLAQEALLLFSKADIREELDRLGAHVAAAQRLLHQGGAVGRKLDFLAQEFNREANTLCAKSNAVDLTAIGLDLKATIDQLREQVQNIE